MKRPDTTGRALSWVRAGNLAPGYGRGTLAALLQSPNPGKLLALTAGHVVGEDARARVNDACEVRAAAGLAIPGRLVDWDPWFGRENPSTSRDAGLVEVAASAIEPWVDQVDWPMGWADPLPGEPLRVLTRHHRLPARMGAGTHTVAMEVGQQRRRYELQDAAIFEVIDAALEPGDSGAAVWNARDEIVGVFTGLAPGSASGNAVMTPMRRILDWAGAGLVLRHAPLQDEGRGAPLLRAAPMSAAAAPLAVTRSGSQESDLAVDTLARTMWAEARSDGEPGMVAVGHVVLNRVMGASWWGSDVVSVCLKFRQFSCWNEDDLNLPQLKQITTADASFAVARRLAETFMQRPANDPDRVRADPTQGATHYFARRLAPWPPWAVGRPVQTEIGGHLFFKGVA